MKRNSTLSRLSALIALIALPFVVTSCMTQNVIVAVNPDGSGNIAVTRVFPAHIVSMIDMQIAAMREQMGEFADEHMPYDLENPYYNEKQLELAARAFGPGVTFVSARPVDRAGAKGAAALYAFDNINDLKINPDVFTSMFSMMETDDENMMETLMEHFGAETVQFVFNSEDDLARLRVMLPTSMTQAAARKMAMDDEPADAAEETESEADAPDDEEPDMDIAPHMALGATGMSPMPFGFDGTESPDEAMRMMFRGVRMSMAVEVRGEVTRAEASHPVPNRPTRFMIYDIDFDRVLDSDDMEELAREDYWEGMTDPSEFMSGLYELRSSVVEGRREIIVEFKGGTP